MANHQIVHMDIPASNPAAASQFYTAAFGWQPIHNAEYDYWMFNAGGGPGGGFVQPGPDPTGGPGNRIDHVVVYINTDDLDASMAQVEAHGGKRLSPNFDMGTNGAYAFFADPEGNTLGLYRGPGTDAPAAS